MNKIEFIKSLPLIGSLSEQKRGLMLQFFNFCERFGLKENAENYKEYRKLVAGYLGHDLAKQRPTKKIKPIAQQMELFAQ